MIPEYLGQVPYITYCNLSEIYEVVIGTYISTSISRGMENLAFYTIGSFIVTLGIVVYIYLIYIQLVCWLVNNIYCLE